MFIFNNFRKQFIIGLIIKSKLEIAEVETYENILNPTWPQKVPRTLVGNSHTGFAAENSTDNEKVRNLTQSRTDVKMSNTRIPNTCRVIAARLARAL